jgi:hypothetical protein
MDRYLLTGIRRDGSSNFGKDYRWELFRPLVGWVLSKEDFIANVKGIDLLKLRGGWGRLETKMFLLIIKRILLV